jgi:DNA-binding transcriptional LysR family regulator
MSRLNLTNLETVCAIARLGTFSAASDRLHASQPAITARVRELESSLGIAFFQRRGRRMELTVEGRQFIDRVEPLVGQIEEAVLMHSDPSAASGVVRMGVGAVTMTWFPDLVGQLKREMPNVHYELDVDMGMNMIEKLESGKLDMAIVAGRVRMPRMTSIDLTPSELQWVMSSRVPRVVDGRRLGIAELLDSAPLWFVSRPSVLFPRAVATARKHGAQLHNINTCGNMIGLLDLIDRGAGIGMVASLLAKERLASGALLPVDPELKPETLELTLLFHKDQQQSVVKRIADRIAEVDRERQPAVARAGSKVRKSAAKALRAV